MYEEKLKIYRQVIQMCEKFELKGKSMPYTSANGYMFSQLNKDGEIGIRFSKEVQERYLKEFNTTIFKSYNAVMKEYILIPEKLLGKLEVLAELLNESYVYVMSLDSK